MQDYVNKLIPKYIDESDRDFNTFTYDLQETPLPVVLEDAETMPFLGEWKVITVKNSVIFSGERCKVEHNVDALLRYLEEPAPFTILVFLAPYEKLDERKKITKKIKEFALVKDCNAPKREADIVEYIREECRGRGVAIAPDAMMRMIELVGENLSLLNHEIEKCYLFVLNQEDRMITRDIVEKLVSRSLEDDVFLMIDQLMNGDTEKALQTLQDLRKQQVEPFMLVGAIASHFRVLYQVKVLQMRSYNESQIVSKLKIAPFRVKRSYGTVRRFSVEQLQTWVHKIAELDYQIKRGPTDSYMDLEFFILCFHVK